MMKKLITTFLGLAVVSSFAFAQSFTITLNPGSLNTADGSTLTHSLQDSAGIGIYYAVGTNTAAGYASSFGTSTSVSASAFSALGGLTWTSLDQAVSGASQYWVNSGWNGGSGANVDASGGETILIALTTGSTVGSTSDGDNVGLLASNVVVGGLGQTNLAFGTQFDVIAGSSINGLTMLTTVPEPSAYGAIAGLLALGCVMLRRRV
ncbi:MAG: hypothetical protein CML11_03955 [Puniceicoccaceae bacterium]|nr:hypothetical protein [Puniceicoccaceae bacterium]